MAGDLNEPYDGIETEETAIVNQYDKFSWCMGSLITTMVNFCRKPNFQSCTIDNDVGFC